jgi:hypothetical protein
MTYQKYISGRAVHPNMEKRDSPYVWREDPERGAEPSDPERDASPEEVVIVDGEVVHYRDYRG